MKLYYLLIVLMLLPGVMALPEEFDLFASDNLASVPAGKISQSTFILQNTGLVKSVYDITLSGSAADIVTISDELVVLDIGQRKDLYLFVNPPVGMHGVKNLTITIRTDFETEQSYTFPISVVNTPNVQASFADDLFSNIPCTGTVYQLDLFNSGPHEERYALSVYGFSSDEILYSFNPVILAPYSRISVPLTLTPHCYKYGWYQGILSVRALGSGHVKEVPFGVHIKRSYTTNINHGQLVNDTASFTTFIPYYEACMHVPLRIPVQVQNPMHFANYYSIDLPAKDWIKVTDTQLSVPARSNGLFEVLVEYPTAGNITVPLEIVSSLGDISYVHPLHISVKDCYAFDASFTHNNDVCQDEESLPLRISNTGSQELHVRYVGMNQSGTATILPHENATLSLTLPEVNETTPISYDLAVWHEEYPDLAHAQFAGSFMLHPGRSCVQPTVQPDSFTHLYEQEEKRLAITNTGIWDAEYALALDPEYSWAYLPSSLTVASKERVMLPLVLFANETVPAADYFTSLVLSSGEYAFTFPLSITVREPTMLESVWLFVNANKLLVLLMIIFIILLILLLVWLLLRLKSSASGQGKKTTSPPVKSKKTTKRDWTWLLWLLVLLLIILVLLGLWWLFGLMADSAVFGNQTVVRNATNMTDVFANATTSTLMTTTTLMSTTTLATNMTTTTVAAFPENGTLTNGSSSLWSFVTSWWSALFARTNQTTTTLSSTTSSQTDLSTTTTATATTTTTEHESTTSTLVVENETTLDVQEEQSSEQPSESSPEQPSLSFWQRFLGHIAYWWEQLTKIPEEQNVTTPIITPLGNVSTNETGISTNASAINVSSLLNTTTTTALVSTTTITTTSTTIVSMQDNTTNISSADRLTFWERITSWWTGLSSSNASGSNQTQASVPPDSPEAPFPLQNESLEDEQEIIYDYDMLTLDEAYMLSSELGNESLFVEYVAYHNISSRLIHMWPVDTTYTLDLAEYFQDPDGDMLYFSYTQPDVLEATLTGATITFTPPALWHGVDQIVFFAQDANGANVTSPVFYLVVTEQTWPTRIVRFLLHNIWYVINAALVIIILALVLMRK